MKHYEEICVLGDGAFGTVIKARDKETGDFVAIKKMKQRFTSFEECLQLKEVKSLRKIKNENVMKLLSVFRENDHLYLVFELLGESLLHTMNKRGTLFNECEIRYIMSQILQGLNFIHRQGFFHRDLKPDNLLWSLDGTTLKLCDFGLAREIRSRPPYSEYVGTRWYRAPEIILRHEFYNSPVDIWAAGCIFAELYMGKTLFQGTSEADQFIKICNVLGTPNSSNWPDGVRLINKRGIRLPQSGAVTLASLIPNASPEALTLIQDMLRYDPMKRPSASQCLKYPFFQGKMYSPLIPQPSDGTTPTDQNISGRRSSQTHPSHPPLPPVQPSFQLNGFSQASMQGTEPSGYGTQKQVDFSFTIPESTNTNLGRGFEMNQPSQGILGNQAARPLFAGLPHHRRNVSFDSGKTGLF